MGGKKKKAAPERVGKGADASEVRFPNPGPKAVSKDDTGVKHGVTKTSRRSVSNTVSGRRLFPFIGDPFGIEASRFCEREASRGTGLAWSLIVFSDDR